MELTLLTAGGRINCLRCTARSNRSGVQCGRPALKISTTQKCGFHGGHSSGPKTAEGRARIAAAHTIHGGYSKEAMALQSAAQIRLRQLEDAMHLLGMTVEARSPGKKPAGYKPLRTLEEVRVALLDMMQNST